jgi:chemotaxis protein CheX
MTQTQNSPQAEPQPANPVIDAKLVLPFVNATREVFKTMLSLDTEIMRPLVRKKDSGPHHDVSGIIGFSGDLVGSAILSFGTAAAVNIVQAFAGERLEVGNPDFADAVGELANMVAGAAKRDLGVNASISVPTVIIGNGYSIAGLSTVPCLVIPCRTAAGDFAVQICIKQVNSD